MAITPLDDVLELAALLRPAWAQISDGIPAWHPRCEEDDADSTDDADADADGDADASGGDDADADTDADGTDKPAGDDLERWKREARKWEGRAKKNATDLAASQTKLREREDADKTEQEKAVEAAARTAREEALSEAQKDRRADKLEMAVTKVAAVRGVKVGTGDDEKTVKFADPDDVQMWLEKQIERGDIDADAIYHDGKVDEDALGDELARLAAAKPGWLAGAAKGNGTGTPAGSADGGRGTPPASGSVEAELKAIQRRRQPASA